MPSSQIVVDGLQVMIDTETERELILGLQMNPKHIPSAYYYDDVGSALFQVQCMQTDYYLNRVEKDIILASGPDILGLMDAKILIDLGCGNAEKTAMLVSRYERGTSPDTIVLVDLNASVLPAAKRRIEGQVDDGVIVKTIAGPYSEVLRQLGNQSRRIGVLFLGSTIGNMTNIQIRSWGDELRTSLAVGDSVLVGADLTKSPGQLLRAYNDHRGVARLTNLNVLSHLNDRYGADFDLDLFEHLVLHFRKDNALRSHLVSLAAQTVRLPVLDLEIELQPGEMIQTELERKFTREELKAVLEPAGFVLDHLFIDPTQSYSMQLFRAVPLESEIGDSKAGAMACQHDVEITADYRDDRCLVGAGL